MEDNSGSQPKDGTTEELPKAVRQKLEKLVPEILRKTFTAGMGAVFATEDGIRRITKDLSLPKDVAGYLVDTAGGAKDEIVRILAKEVREFLQSANLADEVARVLSKVTVEIKTEINFSPVVKSDTDSEASKSDTQEVSSKVSIRRADDTKK